MVAVFQLLIVLSVVAAGIADGRSVGPPPWWPTSTLRRPVVAFWAGWTVLLVFMPWLITLQLTVLGASYATAAVAVYWMNPKQKARSGWGALGTLVYCVAVALLLLVVGIFAHAVQTWEEPCRVESTPMVPRPCDDP